MYHPTPPNVDTAAIEVGGGAADQCYTAYGIPGALPSKTPVSLLQELCMRRGISPKYDLLQIEGAVHEPTFVYRVTVGEFAGTGKSKKLAKRQAAFKMSQRLKDQPVEQPPVTVLTDDDEEVLNLDTHDTQSEEYLSLTETEKKTDGSVNYLKSIVGHELY
ncbi:RISC-loading complex subunit TARBP2 [Portunus trituberculatus]|uniref:RISC-loading complex subunit TARBP2 n=1 Tax=Portunus trituberculatus TaxID=210409 RepID=A0A5B7DDP9_PORTR|nr:RISC-loading complex subunit TARBP2 [Portunus trituberculatus]